MSRTWVIAIICLAGFWWHLHTREPSAVNQPSGVIAPGAPIQQDIKAAPIEFGRFKLQPLANFRTEARVLSRRGYEWDDEAELSPMDFAIGWGRMSDTAVIEQLNIEQSVRFFSYRWSDQPPIPAAEIVSSATNVHLIPADAGVRAALDRVRAGQVVRLDGQLVAAEREDGWRWRSSMSRNDSGAGACELLLVRSVAVLDQGG